MRFTKLKKDTIQSQQLIAFLREEILILEFKPFNVSRHPYLFQYLAASLSIKRGPISAFTF